MSARQIPLRLRSGAGARQIPLRFKPSAPGPCPFCGGSGWRQLDDHRVTRCECRIDREIEEAKVVSLADRKAITDRKSAAAGGDR